MDRDLCLLAINGVFLPTFVRCLEAENFRAVGAEAFETLRGDWRWEDGVRSVSQQLSCVD